MGNESGVHLILPSEYVDATGVVRLARPPLVLGEPEREALEAIAVQAPFFVVGEPPSFHDQIGVYATHEELFRFMLGSDLDLVTEILSPTVDEVVDG